MVSESVCQLILMAFVLTIPARTPPVTKLYRRPAVTAVAAPATPMEFSAPDVLRLIAAPSGHEVAVDRRDRNAVRPAWGALAFFSLFCLHAELDDCVGLSRFWQLYIQHAPVISLGVGCLLVCVCKRLRSRH